MKAAIFTLFILVATFLAAQDQSIITVKNSETSSGVVIVSATQMATGQVKASSFELHCNKGASACKVPEPGTYVMLRLPKNWGMYDCANVDVFASGSNPATDQKVGEYCLVEK